MSNILSYFSQGKYDKILIFTAATLWIFGVFVVYSATRTIGGYTNVLVQFVAGIIGIVLMMLLCYFDYRVLAPLAKYIAVACAGLLIVVLVSGITGIWGSKSWIKIGGISIQPAELTKCGFIISLAYHVSKVKDNINRIPVLAGLLIHLGVPVGLILLQPDFGTAVVYVVIFLVVIFSAGISYKYVIGAAFAGSISAPFVYLILDEYQKKRIQVFLNPDLDPLGRGYNVIQSKIALGSGGAIGNGYLKGTSTQMGFLPAKHTDFIFSSICEELGFLGGIFVIIGLFLLIFRILKIASQAHTYFGKFVCMGVCAMLFFHGFENIGMCMGLLPVTGIPLPLISYGGTSVITNFIAIGLVLSVSRLSRKDRVFGTV